MLVAAERLSQLVARLLGEATGARILRLGGAAGAEEEAFRSRGWSYEGADLREGPGVRHVLSEPYRWAPLGDASFQAIVCLGFLEQVPFFWLAWREMVRVLAQDGVILLAAAPAQDPACFRSGAGGPAALAQLGGLRLDEPEAWPGGPAVFRKPLELPARQALVAPAPLGAPGIPSPLVRDPGYARRLGLTLAEWLVYHHESVLFERVSWMGVKALKNPLDCWIYQEVLWEVRPEVVVEIGGLAGGGALFLCHMLDLIGAGAVVSLDRDRTYFSARHPRLEEVTGDAADPGVRSAIEARCAGRRTLVIHDADHSAEAVLRDLRAYAGLVSPGSYFIVEDGVVELIDSQLAPRLGWTRPGPLAAVRRFVAEDDRFEVDFSRERYLATSNPSGFLRRVR